jgi:polygalacturonase
MMKYFLSRIMTIICCIAGSAHLAFCTEVSVKEFGAKGDGIADDRVAIQLAINAVHASGGGVVNFPEGIYSITAPNKQVEWATQITLYSNLIFRGAGMYKTILKVADHQDAWDVILKGDSITRFSMIDITIDGNGETNPVICNVDAVPSPWYHTLVYLPGAKDIAVQRCRFTNLSGVWAIYVLNRAENVLIDGCVFDNIGGYTTTDWDHSCIRVDGYGPVVISNNIMTSRFGSGTTGTRTAVEIHGSNHKFINNTITGFRSGVNVCSGADEKVAGPSVHQYYIDNKMVNVGCGFNIWGLENRTFDNLVFERNDITIDVTGWQNIFPEFFGIGLITYNPLYTPLLMENVKIIDNQISFINSEGGNKYSFGIRLVSNNLDTPNAINKTARIVNCQVLRNTISGAYLNGIYLNCIVKNMEIADNIIIDPGMGIAEPQWRSAIKLANKMEAVRIINNMFYSHQKTPISCGIYDGSINAGRCSYTNNRVAGTGTKNIPVYLAAPGRKGLSWATGRQ